MAIERAAVLGAGLMGSGIAAHLANAGLQVLLLDMPAKQGPRSGVAASAIGWLALRMAIRCIVGRTRPPYGSGT